METVSKALSHGGVQGVYRHDAGTTACPMTFAVFVPPQAKDGPVPVLWYLSGLTCTHANVMDKGEYRRAAARHGVIVVAPAPGVEKSTPLWARNPGSSTLSSIATRSRPSVATVTVRSRCAARIAGVRARARINATAS